MRSNLNIIIETIHWFRLTEGAMSGLANIHFDYEVLEPYQLETECVEGAIETVELKFRLRKAGLSVIE